MTSELFERVVFVQLPGDPAPVPAGLFSLDPDSGVGRFSYGRRYLRRRNAIALDPVNLPLGEEEYVTRKNGGIFGVLADVLPDSWGKYVLAKRLDIPFGSLRAFEMFDYVSTNAVGALSFGRTPERPDTRDEAPVSFSGLSRVAEAFARVMDGDVRLPPELAALLEQGTSLGGAQPKCPVTCQGAEWIAKFENARTPVPFPRIEYATMLMAGRAGIDVPDIALAEAAGASVYLIRRFDRRAGRRIPFMSAQALCDLDIDELEKGSYVDIARLMRKFVANVGRDLHELFRRMVFNAFVRNQDDHLRNHGFILGRSGWRLSPLYDVLPIPARRGREDFSLSLVIGSRGNRATLDNLYSRCRNFNLTEKQAAEIVAQVDLATRDWEATLRENGVGESEVEAVRWSFEGFRTTQIRAGRG